MNLIKSCCLANTSTSLAVAVQEGMHIYPCSIIIFTQNSLIAIMLAKLRMSVEEATDEFFTIIDEVYKRDDLSPSDRTQKLRECVEAAMQRKGIPLDLMLMEESPAGRCARWGRLMSLTIGITNPHAVSS
jgi:hypothetical protein